MTGNPLMDASNAQALQRMQNSNQNPMMQPQLPLGGMQLPLSGGMQMPIDPLRPLTPPPGVRTFGAPPPMSGAGYGAAGYDPDAMRAALMARGAAMAPQVPTSGQTVGAYTPPPPSIAPIAPLVEQEVDPTAPGGIDYSGPAFNDR